MSGAPTAGALAARLALDSSGFRAEMAAAGATGERELKRIGRQVQFVNDYIKEMARSQKAANDAVAEVQTSAKHMEHFGFQTAAAKRELLVLAHELSQGDYSRFGGSLMVLAERTNAMELAFSAAGVAIGATVAVLVGFAAAAAIGAHEQEELRKALILTGNAAGVTASTYDAFAAAAAASAGTTIGSARDALQALVATGRIGQGSIEEATRATLLMEKLTGESADGIVKDFAKMGDGVAKWAAEHNRQYHYLTAAQFLYIKQLEDQGELDKAAAANFKALNAQMEAVNTQLGYLERGWRAVKDAAADTWDAMKGLGKAQTTAQQIADVQARIDAMQKRGPLNDLTAKSHQVGLDRLRQELYLLQEKAKLEQRSAGLQAANAARDQAAIDKIMHPDKVEPLGAIRDAKQQYKADFMKSEIAAYGELADAERKAAEEAAKLQKERDKSMGDWLTKFQQREQGANMDPLEAQQAAIGKYLRSIGDQTKRAEELVQGSFSRMEDAIINFAKTGKLSLGDLFSFMAEEYIRNLIRMGEKKLLLDSADNFVGFSSMFSSVASLFGSHAGGLDYVPYDGYPAILHQGERVQTAFQAQTERAGTARAGGAIDASVTIGSVGAGTSRAEVASAVQQSQAQQMIRLRRLQQQGLLA